MYHPEFQLMEFIGPSRFNTVDNEKTEEIAYRMSQVIHDTALKNSNKPKNNMFYEQRRVDSVAPVKFPVKFDVKGKPLIYSKAYLGY